MSGHTATSIRELMARAREAEKRRDRSMAAYHNYEVASAAVHLAPRRI